jgi:hypothetical protein
VTDSGLDTERTRLRAAVAAIDLQMKAPATPRPADALQTSWAQLVELLALGPEPELRPCPHCNKLGLKAATRCGYCWNELQTCKT